jgi:hypothetical protein
LDTCSENVYGTDPNKYDTDGDGLTDGEEVTNSGPLADADPLQHDIFVEVDHSGVNKHISSELKPVQDKYAQAPVENPDGSTGIDLHITVDDDLPNETTATLGKVSVDGSISEEYRDYRDSGYHYMVVDSEKGGGVASYGRGVIGNYGMARLFMHELGHSLGIGYDKYNGVDSREVQFDRYRSVMNYNAPYDFLGYNDGAPFDDWEFIADGYTPKRGGGECQSTANWCPMA